MKKPIFIVPVQFGGVASALLIVLFVVLFYMGRHPMGIPIVFDVRFVILPLFMVIAMKDFRDNKNNNTLHFWQGLSVGFVTLLVISFFMSLFIIFFVAVDQDFLQIYIEERTNLLLEHQAQLTESISEEAFQLQLDKLPLTTSFDLAIDYFFKTLGIGVFLNIIIAILLRKQPN
ncbi:MAG: DUF4199 domain-containing protein [Cyclobacteriaceae bacterium]|nr:DUF4199 domain-containing protein [Cyclobacteriaceae bacterium]